jgi:3-hydroxyisobutyrate dehydrogenase-like beta-hydroxyacid dehydrogenase
MAASSIAVVGLGIIGRIWASHLHADGLTVRGWNRTPQPGLPFWCGDLRAAVAASETIIIVVSDPAAVHDVLDRIVPELNGSKRIIQCSTIGIQDTLEVQARVQAAGATMVEAPFTGSKPAAEQRQTVFYLGGAATAIAAVEPVLARLSKARLIIGKMGTASALKLAMNLNIAQVGQALSEALLFSRRQGLTDEIFFEALRLNASRSGVSDLKEPKLCLRDYSPQFSVKHMAKDLRLVLQAIDAAQVPQTAALAGIYQQGIEAGMQNDDFIGLIRLLESSSRG